MRSNSQPARTEARHVQLICNQPFSSPSTQVKPLLQSAWYLPKISWKSAKQRARDSMTVTASLTPVLEGANLNIASTR
jgi:hypothetical protein